MPFESGNAAFRLFKLPRKLPEDAVDRFAENAAPGLTASSEGPQYGWVTGRHLLDRQIEEHTALFGGWLRLTLLEAEMKIPAALLQAEMKREELARMEATGAEGIGRSERAKIKQEITDRLLPQMPPQLKGTPFVARPGEGTVFAGAMSDRASDLFILHFRHACGLAPIPLTPENAALERKQVPATNWATTSFAIDVAPELVCESIGTDFLTWLWYLAETHAGRVDLGDGEVAIMLEGPLTFSLGGLEEISSGAMESVLRKGVPTLSPEATACLRTGKKLKKAKLHLSKGEDLWSCNLDAETFAFRGFKLVDPEERLDAVSLFQHRMIQFERFATCFYELFDRFVDLRRDVDGWRAVIRDMLDWLSEREKAS